MPLLTRLMLSPAARDVMLIAVNPLQYLKVMH